MCGGGGERDKKLGERGSEYSRDGEGVNSRFRGERDGRLRLGEMGVALEKGAQTWNWGDLRN